MKTPDHPADNKDLEEKADTEEQELAETENENKEKGK